MRYSYWVFIFERIIDNEIFANVTKLQVINVLLMPLLKTRLQNIWEEDHELCSRKLISETTPNNLDSIENMIFGDRQIELQCTAEASHPINMFYTSFSTSWVWESFRPNGFRNTWMLEGKSVVVLKDIPQTFWIGWLLWTKCGSITMI